MISLEEILQRNYDVKNAFDGDGNMTLEGEKAYEKMISLMADLGDFFEVNLDNWISRLDEVAGPSVKIELEKDNLIKEPPSIYFYDKNTDEGFILHVLNRHKINDMKCFKDGENLILTDGDNRWDNSEIFQFIHDDVFIPTETRVVAEWILSNDEIERFNELRGKYIRLDRVYSLDEIFDRANNKAFGDPNLTAKDTALFEVAKFMEERGEENPYKEAERTRSSAEDLIFDYLDRNNIGIMFNKNGSIESISPPWIGPAQVDEPAIITVTPPKRIR